MKKTVIAVLLLCAALGFVSAETLMIGNGYFIGMEGTAVALWDAEEALPVLELVDIHEDDQTATLYYAVDFETFIETVPYEDYSDEYGSVSSVEFYSEDLGPVMLHMSGDAEVYADELWAVLGSYMIDTSLGYLTYVCIVAMEDIQEEEQEVDAFNEYVNDIKEDYESEL